MPIQISKTVVLLVSALLLAVDWLALDDITTGDEPHFYLEWAALAVSLLWFGALAAHAWRRRRETGRTS